MITSALTLFIAAAMGICAPSHLRTELIEDTHTVYSSGYPTQASLQQMAKAIDRGEGVRYQAAVINTPTPSLSWALPADISAQSAFRVLIATSAELLREGEADVWDSGIMASDMPTGHTIPNNLLQPSTVYYWTVAIADSNGQWSDYAPAKSLLTAGQWSDVPSRMPLRKTLDKPFTTNILPSGNLFADFAAATFGQLTVTATATRPDTLIIHLGEKEMGQGGVDRAPGASVRYTTYTLPVHTGTDTYTIAFRPDRRNAQIKTARHDVRPVLMPDYIGEVYPFRYVEIESDGTRIDNLTRQTVHYPTNLAASHFHSSDSTLNAVWNLCKHSIYATTFAGVYVDGDRERIPYEADALINQLSHYCTDNEYTLARYTTHYLMDNATWPTEWILQAPILAWHDYMYTGDTTLLASCYDTLKARTLCELASDNHLISTRTGKQTPELLQRCGYWGESIRDIVDWPQSGALGIGKDEPGEADGFQFTDFNTVVNAYHYNALRLMEQIASALGRTSDARFYSSRANQVLHAVNTLMYDNEKEAYRDGIGADHYSLHASMFPMAFGMVPEKHRAKVMEHICSRGMACSVYGAQFLFDALYQGGVPEYALQLLTSKGSRSWWNMIANGSTISWEAWDPQFKPNLDWNHAWGAAPANIIMRKLMGVEPAAPGWSRTRIAPCPGTLRQATATVPTPLGPVEIDFTNLPGKFETTLVVPPGTTADVSLPAPLPSETKASSSKANIYLNGTKLKTGPSRNGTYSLTLPPGKHHLSVH